VCVRGVVQIELQKRASRHLKMSSKETMDVAEKLYQAGWGPSETHLLMIDASSAWIAFVSLKVVAHVPEWCVGCSALALILARLFCLCRHGMPRFISYPRTETEVFKEGTNLYELIQHQTAHHNWGPFAQKLIDVRRTCVACRDHPCPVSREPMFSARRIP
jgi:DNA topoisomerase IA